MAQFLINTTGVVTLTDLGQRILPSGLSNVDIGLEFQIEELRYSADLAAAIQAGTLEVLDDGRGRSIVGPVSAGVAIAFVSDIYHYVDTDVTEVLALSTLDSFGDVTLTSPILDGEALVYNSTSGQWENQTVVGAVSSVNSQTGVVLLDADDISDAATTNKFVTAADITNLSNLSGTNSGDQTSIVGITGTKAQFDTALTDGNFLYVGDAVTTIAAGSANYLSISGGELSVSALAITGVSVFGTYTTLAAFATGEYSGTEFQEGDVVILTAITGGTETYIHNGGVAGTDADFSLIQQPNVDQTTVRGWFSGTAPIGYNSGTGAFSLALKANGGLVIESNELALDLGATAITGTLGVADGGTGLNLSAATNGQLLIGNGSGLTAATLTQGDDITITNAAGAITIGITDSSIGEAKLDITNAGSTGEYLTKAAGDQLTWAALPATKKTWSWGATSSSNNTTNRYLDRHDGASTNQSPYIAFFASKLRAISASTNGAESWLAEVRVNGIAVDAISITGASKGFSSGLDISIAAGDEVSFYCAGTDINMPSVDALFEEV